MSPEVVTSIAAAVVAVFSAVLSTAMGARAARATTRMQHELELQRRQVDKEQLVEEVMGRYREPLLRAAFDLQSRLFNIVRQHFLYVYHRDGTEEDQEYAEVSTMFVFGEYLGWVEILRRGVQFLDLGDIQSNRQLAERLDTVGAILQDDRGDLGADFRVFRARQRALGEVMIRGGSVDKDRGLECIGFAAFTVRFEEDERFARWFQPLRQSVRRLASGDDVTDARLRALQHALIDLIDFMDPEFVRFPAPIRKRL